jgi:hypothetical protein
MKAADLHPPDALRKSGLCLGSSLSIVAAPRPSNPFGLGVKRQLLDGDSNSASAAPAGISARASAGVLKYVQCMRTRGIPTFPTRTQMVA